MATTKKQAEKLPATPISETAAKKAPAAKKAMTTEKTEAKISVSEAASAKKPFPNKTSTTNNQSTLNKTTSDSAVPAKKVAVVKKAEPAVKSAPAKKAEPAIAAKKANSKPEEATDATEATEAKEIVKPAAKVAPAKQPAAEKPAPVVKKVEPVKKPAVKKTGTKKPAPVTVTVRPAPTQPRPMPTPAARSTEKKPNVIIAHRKLESKTKGPKEVENTMIQYQPETYRSILDEPRQQQGPIYRYSDEDLNEFREIILSRIEAARKELGYLQGLITRKDEAGTDDTENRYMNMEDGSGAMEREQLAQLASRQIQFMGHLEKALVRIENKTYGICRVTGSLIDKARLRAVPHATLSIEAKKTMGGK